MKIRSYINEYKLITGFDSAFIIKEKILSSANIPFYLLILVVNPYQHV